MKVKILQPTAWGNPRKPLKKDDIIELPDIVAQRWQKDGVCEVIKESKPKKKRK